MPNNTKEKHPKKFDPQFKPGYMLIGMQGSKIYKLFNSVTQVVEKYRDADFDEYRFPLRQHRMEIRSVAPIDPLLSASPGVNPPASVGTSSRQAKRVASDGRSDRTEIRAEASPRVVDSDPVVQARPQSGVAGGIVTRTPHSQPTRSGRVPVRRVFNDQVVQLVKAMKAVHLENEDTTSLGAPTAPFEAIELEEALKEDAPRWLEAIRAEGTALKNLNTFTIMRGKIPTRRKVITSRWVL